MKLWHKKRDRNIAVLLSLCFTAGLFTFFGLHHRSVPAVLGSEQCSLCAGTRYHAPCLIDLSTGQIGELPVYDPHPYLQGEIAEEQQTGTFSFFFCADIMGWRDTSTYTCHLTLPSESRSMDPTLFCQNCQTILGSFSHKGYALADLYHLNEIQLYPIYDGANYIIRDYAVSVSFNNNSKDLSVDVVGLISGIGCEE